MQIHSSKGFTLVETLIALAIMAIIAVAILGSMTLSSRTTIITNTRETAKNIAETQMEYVKGLPYAGSYTASVPAEYANYTAAIQAAYLQDSFIQKITVTVSLQNKVIITLEGYKVKSGA